MSDFPEFISTSNDIDLLNIYKIVKFKFLLNIEKSVKKVSFLKIIQKIRFRDEWECCSNKFCDFEYMLCTSDRLFYGYRHFAKMISSGPFNHFSLNT